MQDKHDICRTRVENDGMTMLGGAAMGMCVCVYEIAVLGEKAKRKGKKCRQHPDFPGGHPPEYYPSLRLLNFTERTGYGVLSLRWPST